MGTNQATIDFVQGGGVEALFSGILGGKGVEEAVNTIDNSFRILGLSADEAKRQILALAEAQGIDLQNAVFLLSDALTSGRITQEKYNDQLGDLIDLFTDDLPAGVDASAIALDSLSSGGSFDVVEVTKFNDALERQIELYGGLQDATTGGLQTGITAGINAAVAGNDPRAAIQGAVLGSVSQGAIGIVSGFVFDALKPQLDEFQDKFAAAIKSGDISSIQSLAETLVGDTAGVLESFGGVFASLQQINDSITEQADAFVARAGALENAAGLRQFIVDERRGRLSPRQQLAAIDTEQAALDAEVDRIREGGITNHEAARLEKIAERQTELGRQELALADRFVEGSNNFRNAHESGLDAIEAAADIYDLIAGAGQSQLEATQANTREIMALTAAMRGVSVEDIRPSPTRPGRHPQKQFTLPPTPSQPASAPSAATGGGASSSAPTVNINIAIPEGTQITKQDVAEAVFAATRTERFRRTMRGN